MNKQWLDGRSFPISPASVIIQTIWKFTAPPSHQCWHQALHKRHSSWQRHHSHDQEIAWLAYHYLSLAELNRRKVVFFPGLSEIVYWDSIRLEHRIHTYFKGSCGWTQMRLELKKLQTRTTGRSIIDEWDQHPISITNSGGLAKGFYQTLQAHGNTSVAIRIATEVFLAKKSCCVFFSGKPKH